MTASIAFYNNWAAANSEVIPRTATFKLTLHTSSYTFAATQQVYADLTNELSTANGYTNGGATLASVTFNRSTNVVTFDAADTVFTASGGSIVFRRGVIRQLARSMVRLIRWCAQSLATRPQQISPPRQETPARSSGTPPVSTRSPPTEV